MDQRVLLIRFREFKELTHYHLTLVVERKSHFSFCLPARAESFENWFSNHRRSAKNFWGCLFIKRQGLWFWQVEEIPLVSAIAENGFSLAEPFQDRKSTRLNSSHVSISYAVFCLKKKTCQ